MSGRAAVSDSPPTRAFYIWPDFSDNGGFCLALTIGMG